LIVSIEFFVNFLFYQWSAKIDPSLGEKPGKHASEKILEKEIKEFAKHSSNEIEI
jgi:hypothetical protein